MTCDRYIGPFPCCSVVQGDCLELMRLLSGGDEIYGEETCEHPPAIDAIITDPPYGCDKAEWDAKFPVSWYPLARLKAEMVVVITGSSGLKDSVRLVGRDFVDVVSARNMNGMTRGPIGFGNWIAAVIAGCKPEMGPNAFDFCVTGDMPRHPCPKPIEYMEKLIERVTKPEHSILDPFCGSGTTLVAAKKLGRHFLGFEISPEYCDIARKRLDAIGRQPSLFTPKPEQLSLEGDNRG